jgi:hypothetical protein
MFTDFPTESTPSANPPTVERCRKLLGTMAEGRSDDEVVEMYWRFDALAEIVLEHVLREPRNPKPSSLSDG